MGSAIGGGLLLTGRERTHPTTCAIRPDNWSDHSIVVACSDWDDRDIVRLQGADLRRYLLRYVAQGETHLTNGFEPLTAEDIAHHSSNGHIPLSPFNILGYFKPNFDAHTDTICDWCHHAHFIRTGATLSCPHCGYFP